MVTTITSKGQITLPKSIRDKLKLHVGDRLDFIILDNGHLEAIPLKASIKELKGIVPPPQNNVSLEDMERAIAAGATGDWD